MGIKLDRADIFVLLLYIFMFFLSCDNKGNFILIWFFWDRFSKIKSLWNFVETILVLKKKRPFLGGKGNYIESGQPFFVYKLHWEWSRPISVIGKKENLCVFYFSFFLKLHRERSRPISVIGQKKKVDHSRCNYLYLIWKIMLMTKRVWSRSRVLTLIKN